MPISYVSNTSKFFLLIFLCIILGSFHKVCAERPLESPEFLEKSKVDVTMLKEETYKEVLWYKDEH